MNVETLIVTGSMAVPALESKRAVYRETGAYPFLVGSTAVLDEMLQVAAEDEFDAREILRRSRDVDVDTWFDERLAELEIDETDAQLLGEWRGSVTPKSALTTHLDVLSRKLLPEVVLGAVRIDEPWMLPAALNLGGWNECPDAIAQCALMRAWQAEFGAEIAGISRDVIECVVARPPRDRESALRLAWRHYVYCPDIVDQGCETVSNLAGALLDASHWFFWWD